MLEGLGPGFMLGECLEAEQPEAIGVVIDFEFDGVDEKSGVFLAAFNFYLKHHTHYTLNHLNSHFTCLQLRNQATAIIKSTP